MKRTITRDARSLIFLLLLLSLLHPFQTAKLFAQQPASATTSAGVTLKPEVQSLASFEGKWACSGVFPSNGKEIESQIVFLPELEGAWLWVRHDDLPPNRFHALEMWGFDPAENQFVAFIYDNFGGVRKFTSSGWTEDKLIWLGETSKTDPPSVQRFVYTRSSPSQFAVNWEAKKGNAGWAVGDTLTCKK
jgi:hypothetical protein